MSTQAKPLFFAVAALLALQGGCASHPPPSAHAGATPGAIVAFGDSITRGYGLPVGSGWVELLSARLKTDRGAATAVFNAGGNGNTSSEGMQRMETDVLPHLPGIVFVEFGGNDAVHDKRHVSVDDFERNLLIICRRLKDHGGRVVLVTFPPIVDRWHIYRSDPYYQRWGGLDRCVEEYRERTRQVAKRLGLPLFDLDRFLRDAITKDGAEAYIQPDGVHLTARANVAIAEAVRQFSDPK
jgi:lysophospholipase L1-like esterase